jgi:hypothetical protein
MTRQRAANTARTQDCEARDLGTRQAVESLIDEITDHSFPASDPPAWGTALSRLEQLSHCA